MKLMENVIKFHLDQRGLHIGEHTQWSSKAVFNRNCKEILARTMTYAGEWLTLF